MKLFSLFFFLLACACDILVMATCVASRNMLIASSLFMPCDVVVKLCAFVKHYSNI
jgi:hypothetical protein